jgi:tetratricopeptide (TPR) repeat protein
LPEAISDNIHRQLSRPAKPRATTATAWLTAITPDPFETHAERCASYGSALNDLTSAVRAAGEMIRLQPKSALGYRLRGLGLRCNGNAAASIVDYLTAVRLEPNDAEDHYQLALAYKTLGEGAQSESHWNTARQLNPETPELE